MFVLLAPTLLLAALMSARAPAQAPPTLPSPAASDALGPPFEVATIRPSGKDSAGPGGWMGMRLLPSGRLSVRKVTLESLIFYAYITPPTRAKVEGGPAWAHSDLYDIEAKIDDDQMNGWEKLSAAERTARVQPMVRSLLAERFHLKLHAEMRDTPVYALVQAKGGAKLKQVGEPEPLEGDGDSLQKAIKFMQEHPGQAGPGSVMCDASGCRGHAISIDMAIGQISGTAKADRIVINDTGLMGLYDFSYKISREPDALTPMQQLEDQLGLRFESRRVPIKTYVIDAADKPAAE